VAVRWTDDKVDRLIGMILQAGVIAAALLVLAGGVLYLLRYGMLPTNYHTFGSERAEMPSLASILSGVAHADGRAVIELGILVLVATPVIRVVFSVLAFGIQRDRLYVPITLIVLGILFYGLFGSH
jgi:uncharacterized membrane protein